jgi:predicted  nucleic acid-binding Zn-ribbon protein
MDPDIANHPVIKALLNEVERLKKRVEALEYHLKEEHDKIEKLEQEHEHDHETIERLDYETHSTYYNPHRPVAVGL